ncbi:MAG: hypothetical protein JRN45_00665 [Nitrososphaerota archaeon]|nr:hypothetical protein [Nitrososphaerota archaeon]
MGLQNLPCPRCNARTDQLTLLAQLYSPRGWEPVFTLCIACLQVGRYALNEVQRAVYCAVRGKDPQDDLEGEVVACLLAAGASKAGTVQRYLRAPERARPYTLNDHEVDELLRKMEPRGLVIKEVADWTGRVTKKLLEARKSSARRCQKCGSGKVASLYAQMRDRVTDKESKRVVGWLCPACGSYSLEDPQGLIELFVLKGKERR